MEANKSLELLQSKVSIIKDKIIKYEINENALLDI